MPPIVAPPPLPSASASSSTEALLPRNRKPRKPGAGDAPSSGTTSSLPISRLATRKARRSVDIAAELPDSDADTGSGGTSEAQYAGRNNDGPGRGRGFSSASSPAHEHDHEHEHDHGQEPLINRWHRFIWGKHEPKWVRRAHNSIMGHFGDKYIVRG